MAEVEQGVGEIKGVGGHVGLIWRFRLVTIWLGLTSLFMGGCLYLLYRSDSLVMFRWCQSLGVYDFIVSLRPQAHYDNWLVYSLPDGLWMLAYVLLMGAIWNFNVKRVFWHLCLWLLLLLVLSYYKFPGGFLVHLIS